MLDYDRAVKKLKTRKIIYCSRFYGIPVEKFEKEELLKIIDLYCEMVETAKDLKLSMLYMQSVFGLGS